MKLYSIYDAAMQLYMTPFAAHNNGHAIRMFLDTINNPESILHKHPEDFSLDYLCNFDETTGNIDGTPNRIAKATDWINQQQPESKALDITDALKRKKGTA